MTQVPIFNPIASQDKATLEKIALISGQDIYQCMQCGTCSSVCPMVETMGMTTRQGIHLLQFGKTAAVMDARIGELCASCHSCMVRCPRGIDVAKVYDAVRQLTLRENINLIDLNEIPKETLTDAPQIAFVSSFRKLTS